LFSEYFQSVYVRDNSQEDFVVDGGVEDSSTVSLIQLEEKLWSASGALWLWTRKRALGLTRYLH
jgi:hypothetical protein